MSVEYAMLLDRIKAAVIDAVILIASMYAVSELLELFEYVPNAIRILFAVFIFVLYEPLFVSQFGGTIGHSYSGLMVKRDNLLCGNINFFMALIRFILKAFLGWISLLTVTSNNKKKAIHDFLANSVVVVKKR